ncbi:SNF1-related protein kinase catalytic subunit alpha KIN10-like protein, partial [Tanacetum coccineum]
DTKEALELVFQHPDIRGVQSTTSVNGLPKTALAAGRMARCVNMARFAHLCTVMSRMHQRNKGYPFDSLVDFPRRFYGTNLSKAIGDGESIKFYNDHVSSPYREIMIEVLKALQELNVCWKKIGHYNMKCRWDPGRNGMQSSNYFGDESTDIEVEATNVFDDKTDVAEDSGQQVDYDEADREEVVEQTENQAGDTEAVKDKEAAA